GEQFAKLGFTRPWMDAGLTPDRARPWMSLFDTYRFSIDRIVRWLDAGLTGDDVSRFVELGHCSTSAAQLHELVVDGATADEVRAWAELGPGFATHAKDWRAA